MAKSAVLVSYQKKIIRKSHLKQQWFLISALLKNPPNAVIFHGYSQECPVGRYELYGMKPFCIAYLKINL